MFEFVEVFFFFFLFFHPLLSVTSISWLPSEMHHSEPKLVQKLSEMVMNSRVVPPGL